MRGFRGTALTLSRAQNQQAISHRPAPARSLKTGAPEPQSCKTSSILTAASGKTKPTSQTIKRQQSTTRANYLASSQVQPNIQTQAAAPPLDLRQDELEEALGARPAQRRRDEDPNSKHPSQEASSGRGSSESLEAQIASGSDKFVNRHIGPKQEDLQAMLATLGYSSLEELISETVPEEIRMSRPLNLPGALSEHELVEQLKELAAENEAIKWKSFIGLGYYDCVVPPVILRNIFENPGWTTAYTAYQAEIAQGRLESLMNFQTMISDLTGLDVANASLLDESTAAAEAMQVCYRVDRLKRNKFLMSRACHPQTRAVVETRAAGLGIEIDHFDELELLSAGGGGDATNKIDFAQYCGVLVQYPNSEGHLFDLDQITGPAQAAKCLVAVATDLMACTLFKPPGDFEHAADLVIGSAQRFGVPLNYGGPHAGFLACKQKLIRSIPGRVVGLTRDSNGQQAYRFALQTREQHIRRDKATSNICTAQALLANMSAMYAIYHGPAGLRSIANAIHLKTSLLAHLLREPNTKTSRQQQTVDIVNADAFFDTLTLELPGGASQLRQVRARAHEAKINLRYDEPEVASSRKLPRVAISLDETTKLLDVFRLAHLFGNDDDNQSQSTTTATDLAANAQHHLSVPLAGALRHLARASAYLTHPTFNRYHSEAQLVRYMKSLENKDISLAHSMIPLGSCTMKLNATSQMLASSWPEFAQCHPFQPLEQTRGYQRLFEDLNEYLCEITGYDRISFQPNSGAQGEYAGLRVIRAYLDARGETDRNLCLIPISAHGTNPASAQMAGFQIMQVKVLENGNIDKEDFQAKVEANRQRLACFMITYPSTFGVFEADIREMCSLVHEAGGQVYLDGANMNAQVGLCRPGDYGSDVSHLNLHKTFCIPHGGGGPGAGPIGVKSHLVPYLPSHPLIASPDDATPKTLSFGTVSSGMWGSPAILPISWSYIRLMSQHLRRSSEVAILNANYMRKRLERDYKILYRGSRGNVAHEFILDCRPFKRSANIEANDIAKRLQDFGLHAPTVSWPVSNTLMLEPTESEDKQQLDDYCEALLQIRREIARIESGEWDQEANPIKQAPHTQQVICSSDWTRPYTREQAAFPAPFVRPTSKIWPTVGRVDDTYGDTNLFCSCPPVAANEASDTL